MEPSTSTPTVHVADVFVSFNAEAAEVRKEMPAIEAALLKLVRQKLPNATAANLSLQLLGAQAPTAHKAAATTTELATNTGAAVVAVEFKDTDGVVLQQYTLAQYHSGHLSIIGHLEVLDVSTKAPASSLTAPPVAKATDPPTAAPSAVPTAQPSSSPSGHPTFVPTTKSAFN